MKLIIAIIIHKTEILYLRNSMGNQNLGTLGISITPHLLNAPQSEDNSSKKTIKAEQQELVLPAYLAQNKNNIQVISVDNPQISSYKLLYKLEMEALSALTFTKITEAASDKLWKFVTDKENEQFKVGDSLKLGTVELDLITMVDSNGDFIADDLYSQVLLNQQIGREGHDNSMNESRVRKCRICFQVMEDSQNPLLSLCSCEGSVKFTHYQCLKKWQKPKIKFHEQINYNLYEFKIMCCDICKSTIPHLFTYENKLMCLFDDLDNQQSYAILRQSNSLAQRNVYYKIKLFDGASLSVGRGIEADIFINSNKVSRKHCSLFYIHRKLFIRDSASKYGTLHHSNTAAYRFNPEKGISLCLGTHALTISLLKNSWIDFQIPRTCCAARLQINLKIFSNQDEKKTLQTSRGLFDFEFDLLD